MFLICFKIAIHFEQLYLLIMHLEMLPIYYTMFMLAGALEIEGSNLLFAKLIRLL
jgi:hypothetical protein